MVYKSKLDRFLTKKTAIYDCVNPLYYDSNQDNSQAFFKTVTKVMF